MFWAIQNAKLPTKIFFHPWTPLGKARWLPSCKAVFLLATLIKKPEPLKIDGYSIAESNMGTQVFFLNIDISWKYIKKFNISMCTHWLLTLATAKNKNISQNQPWFEQNYLEKPTSAHRYFSFFVMYFHDISIFGKKIVYHQEDSLSSKWC